MLRKTSIARRNPLKRNAPKLTDDIYKEIKGEQGEQRSMIEGKLKSVGRDIDGKFDAADKESNKLRTDAEKAFRSREEEGRKRRLLVGLAEKAKNVISEALQNSRFPIHLVP